MSLRLATRRLALSAKTPNPLSSSPSPALSASASASLAPSVQRRHKWGGLFGFGRKKDAAAADPLSGQLDNPKSREQFLERNMQSGVENNIFQDEIEVKQPMQLSPDGDRPVRGAADAEHKTRENMAFVLDPDPRARIRWERKKVMQMVRRGGRVTREERIMASERELLHKSEFMATSTKKLVMLARQIVGKNVDEAITQMAWSKKKFAAEVKYYLEEARDLAVAQRGMGLGAHNDELLKTPLKIRTRDGKWLEIADPTRMYIAQSWVGRGPWRGKKIDYKGRGRMGIVQHPSTSLTILLKEEKTRVREYKELEAKKDKRGPWVHLPNRPVYGQRPYYSW